MIFDRDLTHLYPPFAAEVQDALTSLAASGLEIFVFEGFRPENQQALRYAQGRTTTGEIVTYARPGKSWHQYGVAVDLVFGGPANWSWAGNYDRVRVMMEARGFASLSFERPHFQKVYGADVQECLEIIRGQGLPAVWKLFDQLREAA